MRSSALELLRNLLLAVDDARDRAFDISPAGDPVRGQVHHRLDGVEAAGQDHLRLAPERPARGPSQHIGLRRLAQLDGRHAQALLEALVGAERLAYGPVLGGGEGVEGMGRGRGEKQGEKHGRTSDLFGNRGILS
jgi:hypothetical protein